MIPDQVKNAAENLLTSRNHHPVNISGYQPIGGGCINQGGKITAGGKSYFIKWNDAGSLPGMFEAEDRGLQLLAQTQTIDIPQPVTHGIGGNFAFLILEFIESGRKRPEFWDHYGRQLAKMHNSSNEYFGLDHDNYIGSLPQSNRRHSSWVSFFIEERLEKQLGMARNSGELNQGHVRKFERLYQRLEEIFPSEKPSLLHGDLWSGNYLTNDQGMPVLIDPAVYYGHREMDLAMTKLFGGFDTQLYHSYHEEWPLEKGFESRVDICNLYPLLVHVNLFGGGYRQQVESIIARF